MTVEYDRFGKKKLAMIWLTHEDAETRSEELDELIKKLKAEKCMVIVYRSGDKDLAAYTKALIKHNL